MYLAFIFMISLTYYNRAVYTRCLTDLLVVICKRFISAESYKKIIF